jgi:xanthine dehydrogenase YagR molybdenum-binding subunit
VDGYDKVSGSAKYTSDLTLPNMAHARILRWFFPHGRNIKIHKSKAEKLPGVLAILTHENAPKIRWYSTSYLFDPLVRYEGDEIACVAAETEAIAEEALRLISVSYEELPFVTDATEAMKADAPKVDPEGNILGGKPFTYERGDVEKGFGEADAVAEDTFSTQVAVHNPLEAHCSLVNWDGDELLIYDSTQAVFSVRDTVASHLKLPTSKVRVIKKYMGGGFGCKLEAGKYTVMAALLAREIGRPVKIALSRREMNLAAGNRPDSVQKLKVGVRKDGTLLAMTHTAHGAVGAHPSGAGCSWPFRTLYRCPNMKVEEYNVLINAGRARPFRAPGHVQGTFGLESILDEAAEKIGMDPLALRMKNHADKDQVYNIPYTSKRLMEAYEAGAKAAGWKEKWSKPGSDPGPVQHGMGLASQIWWGGGGPPAYATCRLNRDGSLHVLTGTQDLGTGTYTFVAQVAAEVLEIPIEKIKVTLGDTGACPYGPTSGGSVTTPSVAPAVRDAAERMKQKLISGAAALLEVDQRMLGYSDGTIAHRSDASKKISIQDVVRQTRERVLVTTGAREANLEGHMINSFGVQFAEVEVNRETGEVKVLKITAAHDVGRLLNPKAGENQFHGGIMQGLGFALMEERVIDPPTGKVLTTNLHDYKVPTIMDTPEIEVIIVSDSDPKISSVGAKGIGEPAMIPTAGAIANAVYNAIGVRIKSLPITSDKILNALHG